MLTFIPRPNIFRVVSTAAILVDRQLDPRAQTGAILPAARLGLLPGVFRQSLLDQGKAREAELTIADLEDGFFLGNALRQLVRAELKIA